MLTHKDSILRLDLTHPTDKGRLDGDFLSYKAEHADKKMSEITAEINLTPQAGETVEIVAGKLAMLNNFVATKMLQSVDNPDYNENDPESPSKIDVSYDCTIRELAMALNGNLGAEMVLDSVSVEDEAAADKYHAMMFSGAEDYKKDFVDGGLPFKSERELLQFIGRGKNAPDFQVHATNGKQGMGQWLRTVQTDI